MINLIVTRHTGLLAYLIEIGLARPGVAVIAHATSDQVRGQRVAGVLPHSLSCLTESFTEIPLTLPVHLRGEELTLEQVREFASPPVTYCVERV